MPYWNHSKPYTVDKAIVAFNDYVETPISVTVNDSYVSLNSENKKTLPAGLFISKIGNIARPLPRAKVTSSFSTGSKTGTVTPSQVFVTGDVLYLMEPYAAVTIAGTWVVNDIIVIRINGSELTHTVSSTNTTTIASAVANDINSGILSAFVKCIPVDNVLNLYATDGTSLYSIAVNKTSTAGTVTVAGSATTLNYSNTAVGTIASVGNNGVITLENNATAALPVGASVGVRVTEILGLHDHAIDFTDAKSRDLNCITAGRIYENSLPYIDGNIKAMFPKMLIRKTF